MGESSVWYIRMNKGQKLILNFVLDSYIEDIPEAEDLISVKRGVKTSCPCFSVSHCSKSQLATNEKGSKLTGEKC